MSSHVIAESQPVTAKPEYDRWLGLAWIGLALFVTVWSGSIIAAAILRYSGHTTMAAWIYAFFKPLCHQISARSFHLFDEQLAVCARCAGIYFGFAAGILLYPIFRSLNDFTTPSRIWLILAPLPTGIDFALGFFGIWENTHWSRFFTAALFGVVAAIYVVPGVMDITQMAWQSITGRKVAADGGIPVAVVVTTSGRAVPSDYSAPERRI
jgi:uncharacterized membrane protein